MPMKVADLRNLYLLEKDFVRAVIRKIFLNELKKGDPKSDYISTFMEDAIPYCFIQLFNNRFFVSKKNHKRYLEEKAIKVTRRFLKRKEVKALPRFFNRYENVGRFFYGLGRSLNSIVKWYMWVMVGIETKEKEYKYIAMREYPAGIFNRLIK